jgi:pimeloyl-ACP methyl ester carboxylesterase
VSATSERRTEPDQSETAPRAVTVDGHRVAYAEHGDPEGTPVVAFHGMPGSRAFGALYDDHARDCGVRVLAFDRPGYGVSADWPDYDAADAPRVVAALLDDAGVDTAGLLAFSGGTPHALATAAALSDRIRAATVVAGAVPPGCADSLPRVQRVLGALAAHTPRLLGGLLRAQAWAADRSDPEFVAAQYATDGTDHLPADVLAATKRDFLQALDGGAAGLVRESRQAVRDWPLDLDAVDCEVAWFHGSRDENVPLAGARACVDALPDATLTILDTDHLGAVAATRERGEALPASNANGEQRNP